MLFWALRQLLLWGAVGAIAMVLLADGGGLRSRLAGSAAGGPQPHAGAAVSLPMAAEPGGSRTLTLRAGSGGHFWADAEVDGATVSFVIDTGATSVTLSREAAAAIGIRLAERDFTVPHRTANGVVHTAPVRLREVRIGPLSVRDVEASVNPRLSGISLLGLSFLKRLDGYEVRGDRLMLHW